MTPLPATDLRQNVLTLAVPHERLPAVAYLMRSILPTEEYDDRFEGQYLRTTYFDTRGFQLRKARGHAERYCVIRVRCYTATERPGGNYAVATYALSA